ncbi:MAG: hypothetical protein QOD30_1026 [Actinomycetota bacterium]|nr:hypothetical protein [Actinomycetota bacterium]
MGTRVGTDDALAINGGAPVREYYLIFGSPRVSDAEVDDVVATLRSGWIGTGPRVAAFEAMARDYLGCDHARALSSCTAGLHLSLIVAGVGPGDEVITTPMTFAASANAILHVGATPVFADCDRTTMNIDPGEVERRVTDRTKAILPVHMAGRPCDMDAIGAIARDNGLVVIEDAAHAFGAELHGRRIGTISDFTVFSFSATKNLTTGEGGMVTTADARAAELIGMYSQHGMSSDAWARYSGEGDRHYLVEVPGYKYNMMDLQAAMAIPQLRAFDAMQARRAELWRFYDQELRDLPLDVPAPPAPGTVHARHLYTVQLDIDRLTIDRDAVKAALHRENVGTGIHFVAVHLHPHYARTFGHARGSYPNAEAISDRTLSLPLSAKVTDGDAEDVVTALRKVLTFYCR